MRWAEVAYRRRKQRIDFPVSVGVSALDLAILISAGDSVCGFGNSVCCAVEALLLFCSIDFQPCIEVDVLRAARGEASQVLVN